MKAIVEGRGEMKPVALGAADAAAIASFASDKSATRSEGPPAPNPAARAHLARGDEFAAAGDDRHALYAYLDAVNLEPRSVDARLKLAAQYARMGHPERASEQWEIALALDPGNAEALRNLRPGGAQK